MTRFLFILYIFSWILLVMFSYFFIDLNFVYLRNLYTGFSYNNRTLSALIYFLLISILFSCFFFVLKKKNLGKINKFLVLPVIGFFSYPAMLSFDIFNYLATAKVTFHYLENPYIIMPIEFLGDPVLLFTRAANKIALYGPLWILISGIPYILSFGNYILGIFFFKAILLLFFLGTIGLIWKLTKSYYSIFYFAANPLVLIETFISGHNDIAMMFFALVSVYLLKNKKTYFALLFLLASILIKYVAIFLVPVFIYHLVKKKDQDWNNFYFYAFISMLLIFFLSPFREEMYPWYAIWPLTFLALIIEKKAFIANLFAIFTFSLMLRYIPFMLLGTYFGPTPLIRSVLTILPLILYMLIVVHRKKTII